MFKFLTFILANFREFPEMSKRKKMKFCIELFEQIEVYMNSYLENNKNKKYYFKNLDLFKSFIFIVLESNDTNYMKIPTDSRVLKLMQDFNKQQELEALKNEHKHSSREKNKTKDADIDKRKTRHPRMSGDSEDYSNDSVSETSDDTNKLVSDNDEVQSFFQLNS
jgi:hypothetical protein